MGIPQPARHPPDVVGNRVRDQHKLGRLQPFGELPLEVVDVDISEAEFIVAVGRGIEEEENLELIEGLVDVVGATLAASRPVVDNGWLPKDRQFGQSGKTVTPEIYLAIGISGAVQHVAGMKSAERIVAINDDPDAPIFDIADYAIVGDLFDVVPELTEIFD